MTVTGDEIGVIFERAGCEGALCVQPLDADGGGAGDGSGGEGAGEGTDAEVRAQSAEFGFRAGEQVTPGSVVKVQIALEAETWFADGRLDPREPVTLRAADRTPGPVGISLFDDDVVLTWRDMVVLMLTISDNVTTDALLGRIGVDAVNATAARLGLTGTVMTSDLRTMIDAIGRDLGRAGWVDAVTWSATASPADLARSDELLVASPALDPVKGTRTTPRDMVRLLRLIWSDRAGPAAACARVRAIMARQLTRHRLASGFARPVRVAAKSGGLAGVVRNEVGVIGCPDGRGYAAAVFTRCPPGSDEAAINAAVGAAAARAVAALRAEGA